MTDTVYLHHHGLDLAHAADLVENHLRALLGDLEASEASETGYGYQGMHLVRTTMSLPRKA